MHGSIAITDYGWYDRLKDRPNLDEVNFWKPSATRTFRADEFSPFFFKLRASEGGAICGFGFFARYSRMPDWFAWQCFGRDNGCDSLDEMRDRIGTIRERIDYRGAKPAEIGCILILHPVFFPPEAWVRPPANWPIRTQTSKKYDLESGEGARVWSECRELASELPRPNIWTLSTSADTRYGTPVTVTPRLGQGTFRAAVTDAYSRSCAVTMEHSLPALDAAHIVPYGEGGRHEVANGLLLRADVHRLFDKGYITVTPDYRLQVGERLRAEFANGHSYYPFNGQPIRTPPSRRERPNPAYLEWHNNHVFLG